jgi:DNA-binding beta-propeller fold protein YncE
MRRAILRVFLATAGAAALFPGCTGQSGNSSAILPTGSADRPAARLAVHSAKYPGLRALYVLDSATRNVDILKNRSYKQIGSISDGANPADVFLDKVGNLYIANAGMPVGAGSIYEYPPNATSPSFTYSAGMNQALNVTLDAHGDVFEGDAAGSGSKVTGAINEYRQGVNKVLYSCGPFASFLGGIAVDSHNDVFVTIHGPTMNPITEYVGGLRGCKATTLGVPASYFGGVAVDKSRNLVVVDGYYNVVDVIAPPYTSVTRTIGSGFVNAYAVTLTRDNRYAFVTDINFRNPLVVVVDYQTGANVTTLGQGNGLTFPVYAVDGPNAVY